MQVHWGLFTDVILAAPGAEVIIGEVECVVALNGRVAGIVVKECDSVVDVGAIMLAPWSRPVRSA